MGKGKVQIWIVKSNLTENYTTRLIRGTLRDVEAMLRQEVDITPCTVEQAREMHDVEIESAEGMS
jgi:hypothetical protein